jgi:hypothetical protein
MSDSPASLIIDLNGNLVGVLYDGSVYRLQVEALVGKDGESANIETMGNRGALAVSYPEMIKLLERINAQLDTLNRHMATVTEESDPL